MKRIPKTVAIALIATLNLTLFSATAGNAAVKLTTEQKKQLQYIVEEEKLARDVYNYIVANVTTQKFSNIVKSEQTHMDQVAALLKSYKVWNPTLNRKVGVFWNQELQALYNELIAQGSADALAAFEVGKLVEVTDIEDIEVMLEKAWPADIKLVLENLLKGSQNHLAAFSR
jgi:hypothetical protein